MSTSEASPGTAPAAATTPPAAGGGTPPPAGASGGAPPAAAPPSTESVNPGAWMAGFSDDMRGYIQNKGFKEPAALADAYRNFEKLQGVPQDRVLKLPEKFRDENGALTPEGRAVFERMGAPKDVKEYELPVSQGLEAGYSEAMAKTMFDLGVPKEMGQKLAEATLKWAQQAQEVQKAQAAQVFKDQDTKLRQEWGAAYETNTNIAKEAVRNMGMDAKQIDAISAALGHEGAMKLLAKFGKATGEAGFRAAPGGNNGPLDPVSARAQITALKNDSGWVKRYNSGDSEARAKMESLMKQAYIGDISFAGHRS